jgi:intracellular septation protein
VSSPKPAMHKPMHPLLRLALDLGPLVIFFLANGRYGIYTATAVFMAATVVAIAIGLVIERKFSPMPLVTLVLVVVFGGLTLWLENEIFIKLKPTILYLMFAAVLWGGLFAGRIFLKYLLAQSVKMPDGAWRILTRRWALFFLALAVINEIVWRSFSTDTWVAFKVWGVFPLTLLFVLTQTPFLARNQIEDEPAPADK